MIPGLTPAEWIDHHTRARPGQIALSWENGTATWRDLNRAVERWSAALAERNLGSADRVLVALPNSPELLVLFAAASRLGAIFAPADPRLTTREMDNLVGRIEPEVIVQLDQREPLSQTPTHIGLEVGQSDIHEPPRTTGEGTTASEPPTPNPDDDGLLIASSGTTGPPSIAVHTWESILWNHRQFIDGLGLDHNDVTLAVAPCHHIAGLHTMVGPLLYAGGGIRLMRSFDPGRVLAAIDSQSVTCTFMVPSMWRRVLDHPGIETLETDSFRLGLVGGAPTDGSLIAQARSSGIRLLEGYGMTEAGPMVSLLEADDPTQHDGGIGRPGMHVRVRAVDTSGTPVDAGTLGELQVSGPNLMDRYWRDSELTEESFDGEWFSTGDLGHVHDDGRLTFCGRTDDMFISGGENIYPGPIERELANLEGVRAVAVVGTRSERWGRAVTAVIEPADDSTPTLDACRRATQHLASFRRPRRLVRLRSLPRGRTGKIQRDELTQKIDDGTIPLDEQRD